jgi:hypothetical protein
MICSYPKFYRTHMLSRPHLCTAHVSTTQMIVPRSTEDKSFWTPLTILPLTVGGGGGGGGGGFQNCC